MSVENLPTHPFLKMKSKKKWLKCGSKKWSKKLFESGPTVRVLSCTTSAPLAQFVYSSIHALLHDKFCSTPRWNDNFPFPFRNLSLMYFHFLFDRKAINLYKAFISS